MYQNKENNRKLSICPAKDVMKKHAISSVLDTKGVISFVANVPSFKDYGCAEMKSVSYSLDGLCINYKKLFVEDYELACEQNLNGIQNHNKLVGKVFVKSKKFGNFEYAGLDAQEIFEVCESLKKSSHQR